MSSRDDWLRRGLCPICRSGRTVVEGLKYCEECRQKRSAYYKDYVRRNREQYAQRRARRKAAGLCTMCGRPRGEDGTETMCPACAEKKRQYAREVANPAARKLRFERMMAGLCTRCGASLDGNADGRYTCAACAKRSREHYTPKRGRRAKD